MSTEFKLPLKDYWVTGPIDHPADSAQPIKVLVVYETKEGWKSYIHSFTDLLLHDYFENGSLGVAAKE